MVLVKQYKIYRAILMFCGCSVFSSNVLPDYFGENSLLCLASRTAFSRCHFLIESLIGVGTKKEAVVHGQPKTYNVD